MTTTLFGMWELFEKLFPTHIFLSQKHIKKQYPENLSYIFREHFVYVCRIKFVTHFVFNEKLKKNKKIVISGSSTDVKEVMLRLSKRFVICFP